MGSASHSITVALTGASGAQYGLRLIAQLLAAHKTVHVVLSKAALIVLGMEVELKLSSNPSQQQQRLCDYFNCLPDQLRVYGEQDWLAPMASGSGISQAMVICPCTTGTLAAVAMGLSNSLLERAADVTLKEGKKLILVVRETPFSVLHLENMLTLARAGAVILPANPGFYNHPQSLDDIFNFIVARILDQLGIEHVLLPRWGDKA